MSLLVMFVRPTRGPSRDPYRPHAGQDHVRGPGRGRAERYL